jgi:hypothetical protein
LINISGTLTTGSKEGILDGGQTYYVDHGSANYTRVASHRCIQVTINPDYQVAVASKATGDGLGDVELGIPLDENLFHELCHALQDLGGNGELVGAHFDPPPAVPDQDWRDRWQAQTDDYEHAKREYESVKITNLYEAERAERGVQLRTRYRTTFAQDKTVKRLQDAAEASGSYRLSLHEKPMFPLDQYYMRIRRLTEAEFYARRGVHRHSIPIIGASGGEPA